MRYGAAPRQTLDLFPARAPRSPLLIFIHGGYWRSNEKTNYGFIAEPIHAHGGALANINYGLAPDYSVGDIIAHAREAVAWLYGNEAAGDIDAAHDNHRGADPGPQTGKFGEHEIADYRNAEQLAVIEGADNRGLRMGIGLNDEQMAEAAENAEADKYQPIELADRRFPVKRHSHRRHH